MPFGNDRDGGLPVTEVQSGSITLPARILKPFHSFSWSNRQRFSSSIAIISVSDGAWSKVRTGRAREWKLTLMFHQTLVAWRYITTTVHFGFALACSTANTAL